MQIISIIGGSGELGGGLALRWARSGRQVIIGSRDADRAAEAAARVNQRSRQYTGPGHDQCGCRKSGRYRCADR